MDDLKNFNITELIDLLNWYTAKYSITKEAGAFQDKHKINKLAIDALLREIHSRRTLPHHESPDFS
jgi:hypothetical protein